MQGRRICEGTTKAGAKCRSFALPESRLCISHDPDYQESQKKARREGGLARSADARTAKQWARLANGVTLNDVPGLLVGAGIACLNGEAEPARVQAFSSAVRAAVGVLETAALEARLRELEDMLAILEPKK